MTGNTATFKGE